jgi:hypothetical protein
MFGFGTAIERVLAGRRLTRESWPDGQFIFNVPGSRFKVNRPPLLGIYEEGTEISYNGHVDIVWVDGSVSPWTPTQIDMAADDWQYFYYEASSMDMQREIVGESKLELSEADWLINVAYKFYMAGEFQRLHGMDLVYITDSREAFAMKQGRAAEFLLLTADDYTELVSYPQKWGAYYDPEVKYEKIRRGEVGGLLGLTVVTDGFFNPLERFIKESSVV